MNRTIHISGVEQKLIYTQLHYHEAKQGINGNRFLLRPAHQSKSDFRGGDTEGVSLVRNDVPQYRRLDHGFWPVKVDEYIAPYPQGHATELVTKDLKFPIWADDCRHGIECYVGTFVTFDRAKLPDNKDIHNSIFDLSSIIAPIQPNLDYEYDKVPSYTDWCSNPTIDNNPVGYSATLTDVYLHMQGIMAKTEGMQVCLRTGFTGDCRYLYSWEYNVFDLQYTHEHDYSHGSDYLGAREVIQQALIAKHPMALKMLETPKEYCIGKDDDDEYTYVPASHPELAIVNDISHYEEGDKDGKMTEEEQKQFDKECPPTIWDEQPED